MHECLEPPTWKARGLLGLFFVRRCFNILELQQRTEGSSMQCTWTQLRGL